MILVLLLGVLLLLLGRGPLANEIIYRRVALGNQSIIGFRTTYLYSRPRAAGRQRLQGGRRTS